MSKMKIENFKLALSRHDWFYQMSDDHRVWKSGQANYDRINRMNRELIDEGILTEDEAKCVWNKHAPDMYQIRDKK